MATAQTFNSNLIKVDVQSVTIIALLDTGASRSAVSEKWLRQLGLRPRPLEMNEANIMYCADGREVKIVGKVSLDLKIKGLTIQYDFLVLCNLSKILFWAWIF